MAFAYGQTFHYMPVAICAWSVSDKIVLRHAGREESALAQALFLVLPRHLELPIRQTRAPTQALAQQAPDMDRDLEIPLVPAMATKAMALALTTAVEISTGQSALSSDRLIT